MSTESINLPWSIRNVKGLFWGMVLGALSVPILFFLSAILWSLTITLIVFPIIVLIVPILYVIYKPAKRFSDVINALNFELLGVKKNGWDTLMFTTVTDGEFFLYYHSGGKYSSPYYKLWIITPKEILTKHPKERKIWVRSSWFNRKREKPGPNKYVDESELEGIKSLRSLNFEKIRQKNGIVAILSDKWLYSEVDDVLRTLKILQEIEDNI
ncbi:MAG: hypothetical protein JSV09_10370 [Thermoplasmata archaeon]|nr:MAG: hypothetical protein JSV09_10370 [Thermoplasmata archaeon]